MRVEPNPRQPEGLRYRPVLIRAGERTPAVLYDNHYPKGHHRHIEGVEEPYAFIDLDHLIADFMAHVMRAMGARE